MKNNIKQIRKERGLTLAQVAQYAGTTAQQIGMLERGDRRLSDVWMERLSFALKVEPYQLITTTTALANTSAIPVLGLCQAGNWSDVINDESTTETLNIDVQNQPNLFAVKVNGDSMEPRFFEGEYLVIDPKEPLENGRYIIAEMHGECTVKKYVIDAGQHYLMPENKRYQPIPINNNNMHYVGTVIERVVREKLI